jgi:hypothetical protein
MLQFNFTRKESEMGMNREDAYYEPDDYDDRTDEIEELTWQLMKKGADYDPNRAGAVAEALSELSVDDAEALQDVIDTGNYEMIGRKIMTMTFEYMERYAKQSAEFQVEN